jgi:hypothetical protein
MSPDRLCDTHHRVLRELISLAAAVHGEGTPGRSRLLSDWLGELVVGLERFGASYRCCRGGDRLGELLCRYLSCTYRSYLESASDRAVARNLRRRAYDLGPVIESLGTDPARRLLGWSRHGVLDIRIGGRFERFLSDNGEDLILIAASHGLGAFIACKRGLPEHLWSDYVVSPQDHSMLENLAGDPWLRQFLSHSIDWLGSHPADRLTILDALGWITDLDERSRGTFAVLLQDWHGSIDAAAVAAARLS